MTVSQGSLRIQRLCRVAGVSRSGYYRFWQTSAPRAHDTAVRSAIQRLALANGRHRGYRYLSHLLRDDTFARGFELGHVGTSCGTFNGALAAAIVVPLADALRHSRFIRSPDFLACP